MCLQLRFEEGEPYSTCFTAIHDDVLQYAATPLIVLPNGFVQCETDHGGIALMHIARARAAVDSKGIDSGEFVFDMFDPEVCLVSE
jgi:hypothetical protein